MQNRAGLWQTVFLPTAVGSMCSIEVRVRAMPAEAVRDLVRAKDPACWTAQDLLAILIDWRGVRRGGTEERFCERALERLIAACPEAPQRLVAGVLSAHAKRLALAFATRVKVAVR